MTEQTDTPREFFERYAAALLARDEKAIAKMYAVPSLIVFPGNSIPVSDTRQTEEFFAAAWGQYEGVNEVFANVQECLAAAGASIQDVVKWTIFIRDGEPLQDGLAAFNEVWGQRPNPPAITGTFVSGLAVPGAVVEIEAVAAVAG